MKLFRLAAAIGLPIVLAAMLFGQEPPQAPYQSDQSGPPAQAPPPAPSLNPEQLQDLVAPIALYPDTLLSQILVASTYPIEVVEAEQWLQQHRQYAGQKLIDEAKKENWDPSVQALVAFPDVLARLNQDIRWTTDLGNAFLFQQADVMNAVQQLRAKAQASGKLQSTPQETVTTQTQNGQSAINIQPADPGVVYVPSYNPEWVWGPPLYGYYPPLYYPGVDVGFSFLPGIDLGLYFGGDWALWGGYGWGWGPDWFGNRVFLNDHFLHRYGFRDDHRALGGVWAHDPNHRLGVPYPNRAVAGRFPGGAEFRGTGDFRGTENFRGSEVPRGSEFVAHKHPLETASKDASKLPCSSVSRSLNPILAAIALLAEYRTAARRECRVITDSPVWATRASVAVEGDSMVALEAPEAAAAVEGTGNMNVRTFTLVFLVAAGSLFAQSTTPRKTAQQTSAPTVVQKTFESPEAATQALLDAVSKDDTAALKAVLGSSAKGILTSGDPEQDESERREFARIANQKHQIEKSSINSHVRILVVGRQEWPFPIPLLQAGQRWRFDPERGAYEMKAREIGGNELAAIQACAAYVGVQQDYAAKKRSPAGTLEFAESVASSPVPKEFADAAGQNPIRPYHGYFFRVLKEQGPNAPGGQHPYKLGKAMIGGFALVAWPATYGVSGIHTFIVNQNGVVYEKDRAARSSTPVATFDPDSTWVPVD